MSFDVVAEVVRLAKANPRVGLARARALASLPDEEGGLHGRYAEGRALFELARTDEAVAVLAEVAEVARGELRDRVDVALAHALWVSGSRDDAEARLAAVEARTTDAVVAALVTSQRGAIALGEGRLDDAERLLRSSSGRLRDAPGELDAAARDVGNLSYLRLVAGDLDGAAPLLEDALQLARRSDEGVVEAGMLQGLGYLAAQRGELPRALRILDEAQAAYARLEHPGRNLSTLHDDLAETHRLAGLTDEAVGHAERALELLRQGGGEDLERLGPAWLQLARCLLDAGQQQGADEAAQEAVRAFDRLGRRSWAHRARLVRLDDPSVPVEPAQLRLDARRAIDQLREDGWPDEAVGVAVRAADVLLRHDDATGALGLLEDLPVGEGDTVTAALDLRLAAVLRDRADGRDPRPALHAARAVALRHRARLADPELRAAAGRTTARFRHWAIDEALAAGDPPRLLAAVDGWRALGQSLPRAEPDGAPSAEAVTAATAPPLGVSDDGPAPTAALTAAERELRARSLRAEAPVTVAEVRTSEEIVEAVSRRLGGRTLLTWFAHQGVLHGLVLDAAGVQHRQLGAAADVDRLALRLHRGLGRELRPGLPVAAASRHRAGVEADAGGLSALLLPDGPPSGEVVVVPPTSLAALPWALVLGDERRPVVQAPSAAAWSQVAPAPVGRRLGMLVGPGLEHGMTDAGGTSGWSDAVVADGQDATSDGLRALVGTVDVLHVAAHGTFRADSPRFSSLELVDGPFHLYALDRLVAPPVVSLAACGAGRSAARPGGELLGVAPAWVAAGARVVIAPVHPVPDAEAGRFAAAVLAALPGATPQAAVAAARVQLSGQGPLAAATAQAFSCYGGDAGRVDGG